jgi:type IV pilus assembly protein PilP
MRIIQATTKAKATFFWTALMLMLAGPSGISSAQGTAATVKPATQATQAQQEQAQAYRYNPEGRIDPFKPFFDLDVAEKKKNVPVLSPLQRVGIEAFTLVGIIESDKSRRAVVQDASGKFYSLVRGTYIGQNKGRVTAIHKDSVIIHERITKDGGKIESRRQVMKLRQDEVKP